MPDYKEMYLLMMRESEKAIRILVDAQQRCEELYLMEETTWVQANAGNVVDFCEKANKDKTND